MMDDCFFNIYIFVGVYLAMRLRVEGFGENDLE